MRKKLIFLGFIVTLFAVSLPVSSCSRKSGCPMNEEVTAKPNRKGEFKKGKSNLFDKQTRKKIANR